MADGGWSSGTWGQAGWGMSVVDRAIAETALAVSEKVVSGSVFNTQLSESAQALQTINARVDFVTNISETVQGSEGVTPQTDFIAFLIEGAQVSAQGVVTASLFSVTIAESLTVSDPVSARFLWEEVDDSATTDWVPVTTSLP